MQTKHRGRQNRSGTPQQLPAGAGLDYPENLLAWIALSTYSDIPTGLLAVSTTVTRLKLSLSYLSQALSVLPIGLEAHRARRTEPGAPHDLLTASPPIDEPPWRDCENARFCR